MLTTINLPTQILGVCVRDSRRRVNREPMSVPPPPSGTVENSPGEGTLTNELPSARLGVGDGLLDLLVRMPGSAHHLDLQGGIDPEMSGVES